MKSRLLFTRFTLLLMSLLIIFSPQVQLAAWYENPKTIQKTGNPLHGYLEEFAQFQEKCPKIFQAYSIDQILDLIEGIEQGDKSCIEEFAELNHLSEFIEYLAEMGSRTLEGPEFSALQKDLMLLPAQILPPMETLPRKSILGAPKYFPFDIQEDSFPKSTLEEASWKKYIPDSHYIGIGTQWTTLRGLPKYPILITQQQLFELCASMWSDCRSFIKKHKKEVLIGAIIVVSVILIAAIAIYCSTVVAAEVAGGVAGGSCISLKENDSLESSSNREGTPLTSVNEITEILIEEFHSTTDLNQPESKEVRTTVKEYISYFAHQVVDELHDELEAVKSLTEPLRDFVGLEENHQVLDRVIFGVSKDDLRELKENSHEAIDDFFGTDSPMHKQMWARCSPQEREEALALLKNIPPEISELWLPPPGFGKKPIDQLPGKIPVTPASAVRGWKVGKPITNLTNRGKIPSWSTVRARYWKNMAHDISKGKVVELKFELNERNIARMKLGRAPQRLTKTGEWESIELHHSPPQRDGGLFDFIEVWPNEHATLDGSRHIGKR